MKNHTNILFGIAAFIGLIGLSATPAFADNIYYALDNDLIANETLVSGIITNTRESASRINHDYAKEYLYAGARVRRKHNVGEKWGLYIQGNRINL